MLLFGLKAVGVQTVNAAKSLYQFWEEMVKQMNPESKVPGKESLNELLVNQGQGSQMVNTMVRHIIDDYPERIVRDFIEDVFIQVISNLRLISVEWFYNALTEIPLNILNSAEKESFIVNLKNKEYIHDKQYYSDFFDKLYKRCKTHSLQTY
jgi:hypothetical protein